MAKLKAVLDSLEGVDEALTGLYTQGQDERYYLALDGVQAHPDVLGLVKNRDEVLGEAKDLRARLKEYEGIEDPEAARAALKRLPDLEQQLKEAPKGAEAIQNLQREHQEAIEKLQRAAATKEQQFREQVEAAKNAARNYYLRNEVHRAIAEHKGVPEFLEHIVRAHVKVVETDAGDFERLRVLDHNGIERIKDGKGTPFTVDDLVAELRDDPKYGRAFEPSGKTGSGAQGTGTGGAGGDSVRAEGGIIKVNPADVVSGKVRISA